MQIKYTTISQTLRTAAPPDLRQRPQRLRDVFANRQLRPEFLRCEPAYYLGVDLGKLEDYTALAIIERAELIRRDLPWLRDPVTRRDHTETLFSLRWLKRVKLGTPYPEIAELVARVTRTPPLNNRVQVIVDATGVGQPVVDLLRQSGLVHGRILPVTITGGASEHGDARRYSVPKRDLLGGLQLALQQGRLFIAREQSAHGEVSALADELREMTVRVDPHSGFAHLEGTRKDDLVLAVSLAWWRASRETGFGARG